MAPKLKNLTICFSGTFEAPEATLRKWTDANGGTYTKKVTPSTTHLVTSKINWQTRVAEVRTALDKPSTKIVTYEWFEDKLLQGGRVHETKYLWSNIDEELLKQEAKEAKAAERETKRLAREKEKKKKDSERIDWGGALLQHTNVIAHVDEDSDGSEDGSEHADTFTKGSKRAKTDLMSENHHIYMDQTGFCYDITLTKVCVELSLYVRTNITLYETNTYPASYAVAAKSSDDTLLRDQILTTTGVNFATAFRVFRKTFKNLTGIEWDDRCKEIPAACMPSISNGAALTPPTTSNKRKKTAKKTKDKHQQGESQVATPPLTPEQVTANLAADFERQKYRYKVPSAGSPRGTMADGSHYYHKYHGKSVYDMFGAAHDRGEKAIAREQEKKDEERRVKKMMMMKKGGKEKGKVKKVETVVIESDEEEEDEEDEEEEDEKEDGDEMDQGEEDGEEGSGDDENEEDEEGEEQDDDEKMEGVETQSGEYTTVDPSANHNVEMDGNNFAAATTGGAIEQHGQIYVDAPAAAYA